MMLLVATSVTPRANSASNSTFSSIETDEEETTIIENNEQTPEESLDKAYQRIRKSLASELLNKVVDLSPAFFERLVVELLVKMGYGGSIKDAGKAMGKSGDEGIDGTIKEDKLGLDIIYIQAKRWRPGNVVGRPEEEGAVIAVDFSFGEGLNIILSFVFIDFLLNLL